MKKGNYGFLVWIYPFISLWALVFGMPLVCFMIAGFVIFAEREEWVIKQCLNVLVFWMFWQVYLTVYIQCFSFADNELLSFFAGPVGAVIGFINSVVWFAIIVIMGLLKVKNGQDMTLFGRKLVNELYGKVVASTGPQFQNIMPSIQAQMAPKPTNQASGQTGGFTPPPPPPSA